MTIKSNCYWRTRATGKGKFRFTRGLLRRGLRPELRGSRRWSPRCTCRPECCTVCSLSPSLGHLRSPRKGKTLCQTVPVTFAWIFVPSFMLLLGSTDSAERVELLPVEIRRKVWATRCGQVLPEWAASAAERGTYGSRSGATPFQGSGGCPPTSLAASK